MKPWWLRLWHWIEIPLDEKGVPLDERFSHQTGRVSWTRRIEYALGTGSDYYYRNRYTSPPLDPSGSPSYPGADSFSHAVSSRGVSMARWRALTAILAYVPEQETELRKRIEALRVDVLRWNPRENPQAIVAELKRASEGWPGRSMLLQLLREV